jgi:hypothetical protein
MTGIVLIIPGMRQTAADVAYCAVGGCYSAKGIALVFIDVDWGFTGLNDLAVTTSAMEAEVRKTHSIIEHRRSVLLGGNQGDCPGDLDSMTVRPMEPADAPAYCTLFRRIFALPPWSEEWTVDAVERTLNYTMARKGFVGLVAENGSDRAGFTTGYHLRQRVVERRARVRRGGG